jgi:hypothetical protein
MCQPFTLHVDRGCGFPLQQSHYITRTTIVTGSVLCLSFFFSQRAQTASGSRSFANAMPTLVRRTFFSRYSCRPQRQIE